MIIYPVILGVARSASHTTGPEEGQKNEDHHIGTCFHICNSGMEYFHPAENSPKPKNKFFGRSLVVATNRHDFDGRNFDPFPISWERERRKERRIE